MIALQIAFEPIGPIISCRGYKKQFLSSIVFLIEIEN